VRRGLLLLLLVVLGLTIRECIPAHFHKGEQPADAPRGPSWP
jgi:hypothetical protein